MVMLSDNLDCYAVDDFGTFQVDVPQGSFVFAPSRFGAGRIQVIEHHDGTREDALHALQGAIVSRL